ncbi:MAG: hypothetical protein GTO12_07995, partial [Proteobacteria bacterium]|nr:hypothetical protein [Pseudomonadota bacterium]
MISLLRSWRLALTCLVWFFVTINAAFAGQTTGPEASRRIVLEARSFAYDPSVIRVRRGERVRLVLRSMDVTHGLLLEGYGVSIRAIPGLEAWAEFTADREGKFVFRCNQ